MRDTPYNQAEVIYVYGYLDGLYERFDGFNMAEVEGFAIICERIYRDEEVSVADLWAGIAALDLHLAKVRSQSRPEKETIEDIVARIRLGTEANIQSILGRAPVSPEQLAAGYACMQG